MCVPYGVHAVYILATHMGCSDVYHMVVQYGVHVACIRDHMYIIMQTVWFYVCAIWDEQMSNTWVNCVSGRRAP